MYDIATKTVNKLNGELSSAFVNVAEENAKTQDIDKASISDSGILEKMPNTDSEDSDSDTTTITSTEDNDEDDDSGETTTEITNEEEDDIPTNDNTRRVLISSGYSVIKS